MSGTERARRRFERLATCVRPTDFGPLNAGSEWLHWRMESCRSESEWYLLHDVLYGRSLFPHRQARMNAEHEFVGP